MNINGVIRFCRIQAGITQKELPKAAGISDSYISIIESGKREMSLSVLEKISSALNISIVLLVFLAVDKDDVKALNFELRKSLSDAVMQQVFWRENENNKVVTNRVGKGELQ